MLEFYETLNKVITRENKKISVNFRDYKNIQKYFVHNKQSKKKERER